MKILGIIPARGGSKGILKKNIKSLRGKPLIAYTIEAALSSKLSGVIVSTDCEEIAKISKKYGADVIMRAIKLAEDETPTLPVLQNVVNCIDVKYDAVMTLQPTSPLRTQKHINESIEFFENDLDVDSLVSVVEVPHAFLPEKLMQYDGKYLHGNTNPIRRQDMSKQYARNGAAIYITKIDLLNNSILGDRILPYFMNECDSVDIDTLDDFFRAEYELSKKEIKFKTEKESCGI